MRTTALATLALLALGPGAALAAAAPGPAPALLPDSTTAFAVDAPADARQQDQRGVNVRVWTEDQRDAFTAGDRTRVFVRTSTGAYVAVLHIDTSGNLEVLFPSSPYDDGYLAAGRLYSLPGGAGSWTVRGAPGVGYLFAVASDQPLEFRSIRALFGTRQAGYGEHVIYGDPYAAMERFARLMVPDWGYVDHVMDWYSYQLGGRYAYPRYACYDSYGSWYYGRGASYDSCDRVRLALRDDPGYYDTRTHRADRRTYLDPGRTRYGYKEDPRVPSASESPSNGRTSLRPDRTGGAPARTTRTGDDPRNDAEPRQRPTLQRREGGGGETRQPSSTPRTEPARPETRRPEPPPSHNPGTGSRGGQSGYEQWLREVDAESGDFHTSSGNYGRGSNGLGVGYSGGSRSNDFGAARGGGSHGSSPVSRPSGGGRGGAGGGPPSD